MFGANLGPTTLTGAQEAAATPEGSIGLREGAQEPQYAALPGHVRHGAQPALQQGESRTVEFTAQNVQAVPAFSQNSFEIPDDHQSFTDPSSTADVGEEEEGEEVAEEESRRATLCSIHLREQALRRAGEIGLAKAILEVNTEREEYLARFGEPGRE